MKNKIILLLLAFFPIFMVASNSQIDSLLLVLDSTIENRDFYHKRKEQKIDSLKYLLLNVSNMEEQYTMLTHIFEEYNKYNLDSALNIANEKYKLAELLKNKHYTRLADLNISEVLGRMGMYKEALDILGSIPSDSLNQEVKIYYYHLYHSLYLLLEENSLSQEGKNSYHSLILKYNDSLMHTLPPTDIVLATMEKGKLLSIGKYNEALQVLDSCLTDHEYDESIEGILNHELSDVYEKIGDIEQQKKYLIIASIHDLKRGVRSYVALRKLAVLLYKEGDLERANTYIRCAMEDAIACKAHFRTLEISETLPIIAASYRKKEEQDRNKLVVSLILISILSFVLCMSVIYTWKQLNKLSVARKTLDKMYKEVKKMNDELNEFNVQLTESNLIKEEYIGTVFNLCSTYINKMESFRIKINRKLKAGQVKETIDQTNSTDLVAIELKEFFYLFDAVFMNLYPDFIEDINALLLEDEKIYPKNEDILSPELRVFALMRLGITNSSKIASFLHYSPQTIYNYKLRVKKKLAVSQEEFAEKIHIKW
ncbi:MAG: hypothetical protein GX963_06155 [Bacteroidales bacterium]|nr:hypothetical protein [Bacteroidales bacterium]